jgi:hypothetical protein
MFELRLLGGALSRTPRDHGALATLDAAFAVSAGGAAVDAASKAAVAKRLEDVRERLAPWTAPRTLLNASAPGLDATAGLRRRDVGAAVCRARRVRPGPAAALALRLSL